MRKTLLAGTAFAGAAVLGMAGSAPASAAFMPANLPADCAGFSNANSGNTCGVIINVTSGTSATATVVLDTGQTGSPAHLGINLTYDSLFGDDVIVGIENTSGRTLKSIGLKGSGNGGGSFGFDGDGACSNGVSGFTGPCGPTGYEGPGVFFTNNFGGSTGTVNFSGGLPNGAEAFFSLESAVQAGAISITNITPAPEPATLTVLGAALAGFGVMRRRRKS